VRSWSVADGPDPAGSADDVRERFIRGGLWVAILVLSAWHVVASLPYVIIAWASHGPVASGLPIWAAYTVVGLPSAVTAVSDGRPAGQRTVGRPIPGWWLAGWRSGALPWAVCAVLLAGTLANELTVVGGILGRDGFAFALAGWFALVALWRRPLPELLAFFAANAVVGVLGLAVMHQTTRADLAMFIVIWSGSSVFEITIYIGSRAVASIAERAALAEEAAAATRNARLAAEAVQATRRARYEAIRATVVPHLEGLSAGTLDLAGTQTRQQIALAVTRLRRFLVENDDVPDPLSHELRACVDAAERHGVAVDLIAAAGMVPILPVGVRRALLEPVIQVLAAAASRARITVVAAEAEVAVAIVADAQLTPPLRTGPAVESADSVEWDWEEGDDRLWAQARWTRLSASLS
jgi:hypothetical protein